MILITSTYKTFSFESPTEGRKEKLFYAVSCTLPFQDIFPILSFTIKHEYLPHQVYYLFYSTWYHK